VFGSAVTIVSESPFESGGNSYLFSSSVDSYILTDGCDDWAVETGDFTPNEINGKSPSVNILWNCERVVW
jgi:hypothetical protein